MTNFVSLNPIQPSHDSHFQSPTTAVQEICSYSRFNPTGLQALIHFDILLILQKRAPITAAEFIILYKQIQNFIHHRKTFPSKKKQSLEIYLQQIPTGCQNCGTLHATLLLSKSL